MTKRAHPTQADRDAAAAFMAFANSYRSTGLNFEERLADAFARHRTGERDAVVEECAKVADAKQRELAILSRNNDGSVHEHLYGDQAEIAANIAEAIRALRHDATAAGEIRAGVGDG